MTFKTTICTRYKFVDGWHIFQSEDVHGLYVASPDAERAYHDIGPSIELLVKLNEGIECKAIPELSYREFLASIRQENEPEDIGLVMSDKRFVLTGVVA